MKEYSLKSTPHKLRYHDLPGGGEPVLFIHGLGCAGSFDYPEVAGQAELSGYRRVLVDMLGAGYSDKPDDFDYSIAGHAEYLREFAAGIGLESFILFGHSLGGAVALSLAALCGERISRVILSEANLDSGGGSASRAIAACGPDGFTAHGFGETVAAGKIGGGAMWAASLSSWLPKAAYMASVSAIEGQTPSWREILYSLKCPRTFIFGERSLPDPDAQTLAGNGIHIETVKDAGHSMAWENPRGLAAAIKNGIEWGNSSAVNFCGGGK